MDENWGDLPVDGKKNVKMYLKETGYEDVYWIHLA
jgi:hypothetical protein